MKTKIKYTDEPMGELKVVKDFLPKPEQLALKEDNVKITISLNKSSIEFFKKNFANAAPPNLRLFAFGVGYDVDTVLLDTLSQEHHGQSTYVRPDEALDEVLSGFYERISTPVLTSLSLDFGSLATYDIYPDPLPDKGQIQGVRRNFVGGSH